MVPDTRADTGKFLRHWMLNCVTVYPIALMLGFLIWLPLGVIQHWLSDYAGLSGLADVLMTVTLFVLPGAVAGYSVGQAQLEVIRDTLKWQIDDDWLWYSALGGVVGSVMVVMMWAHLGDFVVLETLSFWMMPVFLACLSVAQALVLRKYAHSDWLWVLANVTAGLIFSSILFRTTLYIPDVYFRPTVIILWLMAALAQGAVLGYAMLWFYEKLNRFVDIPAPAYVEVYDEYDSLYDDEY